MIIHETQRLIIRELDQGDALFIIELLNEPDWIRFIGDRSIHSTEDAMNYMENGPMKSYRINGFGLYLVKLKGDGPAIGICGLIKREELDDVDIGYAFLANYRGKGYAFEAAKAVLEYGKNGLKLKRILAITAKDNLRSIALLEKIGMKFEGMIMIKGHEEENKMFGMDF